MTHSGGQRNTESPRLPWFSGACATPTNACGLSFGALLRHHGFQKSEKVRDPRTFARLSPGVGFIVDSVGDGFESPAVQTKLWADQEARKSGSALGNLASRSRFGRHLPNEKKRGRNPERQAALTKATPSSRAPQSNPSKVSSRYDRRHFQAKRSSGVQPYKFPDVAGAS